MTQNRGADWRTILLVIGGVCGALFAFILAILTVLVESVQSLLHTLAKGSPSVLQTFVLASALIFAGAMLLPAVYFGIQRLRGREPAAGAPRTLKIWEVIFLLPIWIGVSYLAQWLYNFGILGWLAPPLYLLAIVLPAYLLVRLTTGGLNAGSQERFWGALATGMAVGTSIAVVIELMLLIIVLIGVGIYAGLNPQFLESFRQLANQLSNAANLDEVLTLAGPWLASPWAILIGLFFFSILTPLIEETCKSIAPWLIFDRLDSPVQGFAAGALSGAGFGLLESLLASAMPDANWATTLLVRGGSTMMHIAAASITGWGIGMFRANKRFRYLIAAYLTAMGLHSLWNACVVIIVDGGFRLVAGTRSPDAIGVFMAFTGASILVILCIIIPLALGLANWRFRAAAKAEALIGPPVVDRQS
jgi:RsiW-degrading membrane proteinase PrsW (M82 family)